MTPPSPRRPRRSSRPGRKRPPAARAALPLDAVPHVGPLGDSSLPVRLPRLVAAPPSGLGMTCRELGGPTPRGGPGAQPAGPRLPLHELTRGPGGGGGPSTAHGTSEGSDAARSHRRYGRFRPPGSHPVSGTFSSSQFGEKDHHQDRCEIPHCYVVITVVLACLCV